MPKFFVKEENIREDTIVITKDDVNHIKNVLRLKTNDTIEICSLTTSQNYLCAIQEIQKEQIICSIVQKLEKQVEAEKVELTILQGLPKLDKMETVIQKSTELGAKEITPVFMKHCIAKIEAKDEAKKIQRWQKIAEVAAKQSRRDKIPTIQPVISLKNLCSFFENYDIVIVAYEKEQEHTLKQVMQKIKEEKQQTKKIKIAVLIGPEGGIAEEEIEQLSQSSNVSVVTLGKRILRTETVALMISSIIMYELEDNQ